MGTEMVAFIEYDRTPDRWREFHPDPKIPLPSPFSEAQGEPYSLTTRGGIFTGSKDYLFFGAIAGVRNQTDIPPLFPPRGLPTNLSPELRRAVQEFGPPHMLGNHDDSWLRLSEINAALDQHRVDRNLLSFETHTILAVMENLAGRLGDDRVRLVFGFD
jgi:hypothetical protein